MVKHTIGAAFIVLLGAVGSRQALPPTAAPFQIAPGRVGPLEVGMGVDEVYGEVGRAQTTLVDGFHEGFFTPILDIRVAGTSVAPALRAFLEASCSEFVVDFIEVHDPKFRTPDGLGVGSTLGELRRLRKLKPIHNEGPWAVVETDGMAFRVDFENGDDTRIEYVRVGDPTADAGKRKPCR